MGNGKNGLGRLLSVLAQNVRYQRKLRRLTQESLSESAGIHNTYLGHIERSRKAPSLEVLCKLSRALGLEPAQLILEPKKELAAPKVVVPCRLAAGGIRLCDAVHVKRLVKIVSKARI